MIKSMTRLPREASEETHECPKGAQSEMTESTLFFLSASSVRICDVMKWSH
jgi:hypothetical protein